MALAMGCGSGHDESKIHDVTDPGNQPVGSAREFWIYESNADGVGTSAPIALDSLHFFPGSMAINGEDFFWIADSAYKLSRVQYRPSMLVKIPHNVPNIPIAPNQSGLLTLDLPFENFDQQFAPNWEFILKPTFTVTRSAPDHTFNGALKFRIQHACFRMINKEPYLQILPRDGQLTQEIIKDQGFTVAGSGVDIVLEKLYTNEDHAIFAQPCAADGGSLATMMRVELNFQNNSAAEAQIEFTGLKVRYLTFE